MISRMEVTAEYENTYGSQRDGWQVEDVVEIRMSKKNAAKFAKRIKKAGDDLYAAYEMIDENTVGFANGYQGNALWDMILEDLLGTLGTYDYKWKE